MNSRITAVDFGGDPNDPLNWIESEGETLRELPWRRVFRAGAGGQRAVVKEYRPKRLRDRLRSRAATEAGQALDAMARGVPIVEPMAYATLPDGREWLVLREVEGARTLQELILQDSITGAARHKLAQAVGELIAALHGAGFQHKDLHPGNVLVRPDGGVLLADPAGLRPRPGFYLREKERARSLAMFAPFFFTHSPQSDLLLFWGAYGRASELQPDHLESLRGATLDQIPGAFRDLSRRRARAERSRGQPVVIGDYRGFVSGEFPFPLLQRSIEASRDLSLADELLKKGNTSWTFRMNDLVVKTFRPKKVTRPLRDWFMGTRAERAQRAAHALKHRGFETPEVVAVLNSERLVRSILITRFATGYVSIEECVRNLDAAGARDMARLFGRLLRRMHDWGLRHRDLKKDNFLVSPDGSRILFLDLDGVSETGNGGLDWERRARDLGNLGSSLLIERLVPRTLLFRALDAYLSTRHPAELAPGAFTWKTIRATEAFRRRRMQYLETNA